MRRTTATGDSDWKSQRIDNKAKKANDLKGQLVVLLSVDSQNVGQRPASSWYASPKIAKKALRETINADL
eukprot:scaffold434548_cov32-Prasinocladus_malaysianus.AAC.1